MEKDNLIDKIVELNKDLLPEIRDDYLVIKHPEFKFDKSFLCDNDDIIKDVTTFLEIIYIKGKCFYKDNYIEFIINLSQSNFVNTLGRIQFSIEKGPEITDRIHYEIGQISDEFFEFIDNTLEFDYIKSDFTTLKIYNINRLLESDIRSETFIREAENIAKSIIFDVSHKTSISLKLIDISTIKKDEAIPFEDILKRAKLIDKKTATLSYDRDLIQYYYRAIQMPSGEFQYLAFYQVLECIFDEVYLSETIHDSRKIIESSWFSSGNDKSIEKLVNIIDRYNKEKDDREKIKLVLKKYFREDTRDEAYLLANEAIFNVLKKLKKMSDIKELKDIQKLGNIIYDYRCKCTHSNRTYPFQTEFRGSQEELDLYIELIKKVTEKIVINYKA